MGGVCIYTHICKKFVDMKGRIIEKASVVKKEDRLVPPRQVMN